MKISAAIFCVFLISFGSYFTAKGQQREKQKVMTDRNTVVIIPIVTGYDIDKNHPIGKAYYSGKVQYLTPGKAKTPINKLSDGKGQLQQFEQGWIIYHPNFGAHYLPNQIAAMWHSYGGEKGAFGYPKSTEVSIPGSGFSGLQPKGFEAVTLERGLIRVETSLFSSQAGPFETHGLIYQKYLELEGKKGLELGKVLSIEEVMPDKAGRYNLFENGHIYWHPKHGAHVVYNDAMGAAYTLNLETLGYPIREAVTIRESKPELFGQKEKIRKQQEFSNGRILYDLDAESVTVLDRNGKKLPPYNRTYEVSIIKIDAHHSTPLVGSIKVDYVAAAGYHVSKTLFENKDEKKDIFYYERYLPKDLKITHTFQTRSVIRSAASDKNPMLRISGKLGHGAYFVHEIPLSKLYYSKSNMIIPIRAGTHYGDITLQFVPGGQTMMNPILLKGLASPSDVESQEKISVPLILLKSDNN